MGDNEYKRDAEFKADAKDGDADGFVQDGTIHERPVEEPAEVVEAEVVEEKTPAPAAAAPAAPKKVKNSGSVPKTQLTSGTVVRLSSVDFDSLAKNSASVAAVQVRLIELGYYDAGSDNRGDIGDGTCKALCAFQEDKGIEGCCCNDAPVIEALFDKTTIKVLP
jgi:peptidoglycan hydrolase-like protein with peptidoglycan-binding domain